MSNVTKARWRAKYYYHPDNIFHSYGIDNEIGVRIADISLDKITMKIKEASMTGYRDRRFESR